MSILNKLIFFFLIIFSILFGIFLFEKINLPIAYKNDLLREAPDLAEADKDLRTLDLYPYTGWHILSDFHYTGPLNFEKVPYQETDIKTGKNGFFIDFDLDDPPEKDEDEFRIILVGGSGAMGYGGQTNDKMFYKLLEKKINKESGLKKKIKVINLAMAGSILYQNYIALNKWGHKLNPDLILCYNGVNDIFIPIINESDSYLRFNELKGLTLLLRASETPGMLEKISKIFPKTINETGLGQSLKMLFHQNYFYKLGKDRFKKDSRIKNISKREIFDKIIIPNTVDTLKSIKRDFMGIPIIFALQITDKETATHFVNDLGENYYNDFFTKIKQNTLGYYNNNWFFINAHKFFENDEKPYFSTHLANEGHNFLSTFLSQQITNYLKNIH